MAAEPAGEVPRRRRRLRLGFRTRVLGFAAVLLVGATAAGLLVQRAVLLERLDRAVTEELEQERAEMEQLAAGSDPATGEPFEGDVVAIFETYLNRNVPGSGEAYLTFVDGEPYRRTQAPVGLDRDPELVARWGSLTEGERGEVPSAAGPVRYLAVPLVSDGETRGVFVVVNFVQDERDEIDSDLRVAALVVAVLVAIAIGIAWSTAGRLLRPLREVTATARSIEETDLSRRIPVEGDDEVAELARTFNQMLDRLETAFAIQRAFVDDAGHELRTPITVVIGQLELMGDDPEERARTLAVVEDELRRMARIVEDLLLLAKAEQSDFVRAEPVELADLTTELLVKASTLGDRGWTLDACAEGGVRLDPQRLTQAVLNLARNAVEHTDEGTPVALGSAVVGDRVRFWVRDEGPGVPPQDRERIFERFARAGQDRRRSDGAGLGLAIVRAVAVGHGGEVRIEESPGGGATFVVDLPARDLVPADPADDPEPVDVTPPAGTGAAAPTPRADATVELDPGVTDELPGPSAPPPDPGGSRPAAPRPGGS